ncbi:MAG: DUF1232 domain-containing protein [Ruminococcaceae bacterium]|nr:DUF1232 domain-containing protein [Oscillospiraceae bacterium]
MRNKIKEENKKKELKESGEDAQYSATEDKLESFFQMLEKKIKLVPIAGDKLAYIPAYASLIMHFVRKEYTEIPIGSMIAIIAALIYFISPFDLIPDSIPGIGLIDDALVTGFCWKLVESDMAEYNKWRKETFNGEKK